MSKPSNRHFDRNAALLQSKQATLEKLVRLGGLQRATAEERRSAQENVQASPGPDWELIARVNAELDAPEAAAEPLHQPTTREAFFRALAEALDVGGTYLSRARKDLRQAQKTLDQRKPETAAILADLGVKIQVAAEARAVARVERLIAGQTPRAPSRAAILKALTVHKPGAVEREERWSRPERAAKRGALRFPPSGGRATRKEIGRSKPLRERTEAIHALLAACGIASDVDSLARILRRARKADRV